MPAMALDDLRPAVRRTQRDPVWWCETTLGDEFWSVQEDILGSLATHEKIIVASGNGIGKTFIASRAVLWFLHAYAPAIVATTAPTAHQMENLLWREIRTGYSQLPPELQRESRCLTKKLQFLTLDGKVRPDQVGWGRSTDNPSYFQGLHHPHLMAVVDEAAGVDDEIYEALDTWSAGGVYRELLIGNPLSGEGKFYRAFHNPELGYKRFRVPIPDTPHWTDEEVSEKVAGTLVQPERVEKWAIDWGENSAAYKSRVLAQFPTAGAEDVIIPLSWIEQAKRRSENWEPSADASLQVGVDVARFGSDRTSTASRCGMGIEEIQSTTEDTAAPEVAYMASEAAIKLREKYGRNVRVLIDETGVGGGALDICKTRSDPGIRYIGFQFGGKAFDAERRTNAGSEAYWGLRDYAESENHFSNLVINCEGPAVDRFAAQVSERKYDYDSKGRLRIERKADMKNRGVASPDEADAVAMAFARGEEQQRAPRSFQG